MNPGEVRESLDAPRGDVVEVTAEMAVETLRAEARYLEEHRLGLDRKGEQAKWLRLCADAVEVRVAELENPDVRTVLAFDEAGMAEAEIQRDKTVEALVSALQRCRSNFVFAVRGVPVRDMAETLAEVDAAVAAVAATPSPSGEPE